MVEQGSVIAGRYRLDHLLGEGGMGAVWAATHQLTGKRVAIKLLKADAATPDTLRRFVREARAASAVRHPNVVEIHDFLSLDDGSPAMIMDLLEGETLAQRLRRLGVLPMADLSSIMAPVLSAVGSAHAAGVIHRDLKPDNIFLALLGDGRTEPMVLDFGIAKVLPFEETLESDEQLTRTGAVVGTPYYMAPEQAFGEKDVDARIDVWALGVILYECATGRKPIRGETLGQVFKSIIAGPIPHLADTDPHLPVKFALLVDRMLSRDREQRPRDLREPFELLRDMSGVNARSFGAAAAIAPDASTLPAKEPGGAALVGSSAVTFTKRVRPEASSFGRNALFGFAALLVGLLGIGIWTTLRGYDGATISPSAAPVALAAPAAPAVPPPTPSRVEAPSSSSPASSSNAARSPASARPAAVARRIAPSSSAKAEASAQPALASSVVPPVERQLPGGVNGRIPF
jgi:serine/threonine-protein kinase